MYEIINPLYANGRWYEICIESDGTNLDTHFTDLPDIIVKDKKITFPENFNVVEACADYTIRPGKSGSLEPTISVDSKGKYCVSIASPEIYEIVHLYIFGHSNKRCIW